MLTVRTSYLVKLLVFVIGLVISLEFISYVATRLVINKAVNQHAHAELFAGGELFSRILQKNVEQLALSVKVLTEDFGFKDAVASGDENTIRSALTNHARRVRADLGVLITNDGKLISSNQTLEFNVSDEFNRLKQRAETRGQAYDTVVVNGSAYQFVFFAVKAPVTIGLAGMGFEIRKELSDDLKKLTSLDTSFVHINDRHQPEYLTGTLTAQDKDALLMELNKNIKLGDIFMYDGIMSLMVPVIGRQEQLVAVLQIPLAHVLSEFSQLNIQLIVLAIVFSLVAAIAAIILARSVTSPVTLLAGIARRMADGVYATPINVKASDEIGDLASAFVSMQAAISEREREVLFQSEHDPLTGLPNRLKIFPCLQAAIKELIPGVGNLYLLVVDIKGFSQINDELSQEIGDALLKAVAQKLEQQLAGALIMRLGSDEFLVAMTLADKAQLTELTEKIHSLFKVPLDVSRIQISVEVNIGVAAYPQDADSAESLLRRANLALNKGRANSQRTCLYQHGWDESHLRRLHIFREFDTSLDAGHISVYFQPKVNLKNPQMLGAEALVRWHHPELGFISPEEFIGVIESSGQITRLTRWVLARALCCLHELLQKNIELKLSINLSALDLLIDDLPDYIAGIIDRYKIPPHLVCLEVTESAIMREADKCLHNLQRLQAIGVILSIDDFGTGYSSLSQLKKLPVSELKIDKSFILNLESSADDQLIVRSTIDLGHTLGLSVTAEGVETNGIKLLLIDYGCDTAQGYLYSKPLPYAQFDSWISSYLAGIK